MRTTIDLPEDLYRSLKARAALAGISLRELVQRLIEQGLRADILESRSSKGRREPPPVIIPPCGVPIPAVSHEERKRLDESEDQAKNDRSA